jgi:hypothetical protein
MHLPSKASRCESLLANLVLATVDSLAAVVHGLSTVMGRGAGLVAKEGLGDVGDDSSASDGCLDEAIELLISSDRQKKMSGRNSLHLELLAAVAGQLEDFSTEVLHDGRGVDCSSGTNTLTAVDSVLQESVDSSDRELETSTRRSRLRGSLGRGGLSALAALAALAAFAAFRSEVHFCF